MTKAERIQSVKDQIMANEISKEDLLGKIQADFDVQEKTANNYIDDALGELFEEGKEAPDSFRNAPPEDQEGASGEDPSKEDKTDDEDAKGGVEDQNEDFVFSDGVTISQDQHTELSRRVRESIYDNMPKEELVEMLHTDYEVSKEAMALFIDGCFTQMLKEGFEMPDAIGLGYVLESELGEVVPADVMEQLKVRIEEGINGEVPRGELALMLATDYNVSEDVVNGVIDTIIANYKEEGREVPNGVANGYITEGEQMDAINAERKEREARENDARIARENDVKKQAEAQELADKKALEAQEKRDQEAKEQEEEAVKSEAQLALEQFEAQGNVVPEGCLLAYRRRGTALQTTIYSEREWKMLGLNKEGWREVVQVPQEVKDLENKK